MNDDFNFNRLILLLKNNLIEHKQKYLYYIIGMFFLGLIANIFVLSVENFHARYDSSTYTATTKWEGIQIILYLGGLFIFGGIFASVSFVDFNNKGEGIFYLIKPASQFEKWLTEVIIHVFLFFVVYAFVFYLLDIPMTFIVRGLEYQDYLEDLKNFTLEEKADKIFHPSQIFHFYVKEIEKMVFLYFIFTSIYFSIVAFFMYGSILFNRFSFFKTLIMGFVVGMIYFFYFLVIKRGKMFFPKGWSGRMTYAYQRIDDVRKFKVEIDDNWMFLIGLCLVVFIPVILFTCSYFKLKEKEI